MNEKNHTSKYSSLGSSANLTETSVKSYASNSITLGFNAINEHNNSIVISTSKAGEPNTLEFRDNGDIFVHGKLIENDKEIVEGFRTFLNGLIKQNHVKSIEQ
jgi:hypothetical protein